jgi:glutamine---fructose-6-phosphate transaminase (isomerizing)
MPLPTQTRMFAESAEASAMVALQLAENDALITGLATRLRKLRPKILVTCARGSSDHAATYAKYLFETRLGIPTLSHAPSVSSIYDGPTLDLKGQAFLTISQSGRSPDLLLSAQAAKKAGAFVIALGNDTASPLASMADVTVPLRAGPETSVAATKSYICTLAALAQLAAKWSGDTNLQQSCDLLPHHLEKAWQADWQTAEPIFVNAGSFFVLGRGLTLGIAQEAALKFKETSGLHAEAYSFAEIAHGPMALVKKGFPVLAFTPLDAAIAGATEVLARFAERGAKVAVVGQSVPNTLELPLQSGLNPVTAPIAMIQSFYRLVNSLSLQRGFHPDNPPFLSKVTQTR